MNSSLQRAFSFGSTDGIAERRDESDEDDDDDLPIVEIDLRY
jgi:hypothetical protein